MFFNLESYMNRVVKLRGVMLSSLGLFYRRPPSTRAPHVRPDRCVLLMAASPIRPPLLFSLLYIDSNENKLPIQINTMSRSHPSRQKYLPSMIPWGRGTTGALVLLTSRGVRRG